MQSQVQAGNRLWLKLLAQLTRNARVSQHSQWVNTVETINDGRIVQTLQARKVRWETLVNVDTSRLTNPVHAKNREPNSILPITGDKARLVQRRGGKSSDRCKRLLSMAVLPLAIGRRVLLPDALSQAKRYKSPFREHLAIVTSNPNDNIFHRELVAETSNQRNEDVKEIRLRLRVEIPNKTREVTFEDEQITSSITRGVGKWSTKVNMKSRACTQRP